MTPDEERGPRPRPLLCPACGARLRPPAWRWDKAYHCLPCLRDYGQYTLLHPPGADPAAALRVLEPWR